MRKWQVLQKEEVQERQKVSCFNITDFSDGDDALNVIISMLMMHLIDTLFVEPKELLVFFPEDYSAAKVSKNKILGTAQQLTGLKENTWVNVDIGDQDPWKGLIIKTGE